VAACSLHLLIPALIADQDDLAALRATVAAIPSRLPAVVHPLLQIPAPGAAMAGPMLGSAKPEFTFAGIVAGLTEVCECPLEAVFLGSPRGKWGALREGMACCSRAPWLAVADGDNAYDLSVLPHMLARAEADHIDLIQGQRQQIVLDRSALGQQRALLEHVVNELLRTFLADLGSELAPGVTDLQSGLLLVRKELLEAFFAQPRMDGAAVPAGPSLAVRPADGAASQTPGHLPWTHYGAELHLHAFASCRGARVEGQVVTARFGRVSGLTTAAIGQMLRASRYFQGVTEERVERAVAVTAARERWDPAQITLARAVAAEAFAV
jgi:hypothetical protein